MNVEIHPQIAGPVLITGRAGREVGLYDSGMCRLRESAEQQERSHGTESPNF